MFPRSNVVDERLCAIVSRGPTTGKIVPILATDEPRIVQRVVEAFSDVLIEEARDHGDGALAGNAGQASEFPSSNDREDESVS